MAKPRRISALKYLQLYFISALSAWRAVGLAVLAMLGTALSHSSSHPGLRVQFGRGTLNLGRGGQMIGICDSKRLQRIRSAYVETSSGVKKISKLARAR